MFYCIGIKFSNINVYDSEDGTVGYVKKGVVRNVNPLFINKDFDYIYNSLNYEEKSLCVKTDIFVSVITKNCLQYCKDDKMYIFELFNNVDDSYFVYVNNVLYKVIYVELEPYFLPCKDSVLIADLKGKTEIQIKDVRHLAKSYSTAKYRRELMIEDIILL